MPEIPELQHVAAVLRRRLAGREISAVEILRPIIIRAPADQFQAAVVGAHLVDVRRSGKFLLFDIERDAEADTIAVAPMLNGRFQWCADAKRHARTACEFTFAPAEGDPGPTCIRFIDERFLAKIYLAPTAGLASVPVLGEQGPDAKDPALTQDVFLDRLKRYRGQVKNVLVNAKFIAGIGNAYADEILFAARIHPFAKVARLDQAERARLYDAIGETLDWASALAAEQIGDRIDRKPRDFLRVHRKGGQPCPACGAAISEIAPNRRITSFCRACQPPG